VCDYKYSGETKVRKLKAGEESGTAVQAALYLLALCRTFGYEPGGMFYWALKAKYARGLIGWHALPEFRAVGQWMTREALQRKLDVALARAVEAARSIRSGCIEREHGSEGCERCEATDLCRASRVEWAVVHIAGGRE
jgi:hypothetical protein